MRAGRPPGVSAHVARIDRRASPSRGEAPRHQRLSEDPRRGRILAVLQHAASLHQRNPVARRQALRKAAHGLRGGTQGWAPARRKRRSRGALPLQETETIRADTAPSPPLASRLPLCAKSDNPGWCPHHDHGTPTRTRSRRRVEGCRPKGQHRNPPRQNHTEPHQHAMWRRLPQGQPLATIMACLHNRASMS
jgi:hypothetical protein